MHKQSFLPNLPRSRAFKSSITEVLNFIRDNIEDLLTKRAIVYTIDNPVIGRDYSSGLMVMDDDEIKKMQNREEEGKRFDGDLIICSIDKNRMKMARKMTKYI